MDDGPTGLVSYSSEGVPLDLLKREEVWWSEPSMVTMKGDTTWEVAAESIHRGGGMDKM
jgi:hypothetical protein